MIRKPCDLVSSRVRDALTGEAEEFSEGAKVISLHTRRLPRDLCTSLPDMAKYDRLLAPVKTSTTEQRKGTTARPSQTASRLRTTAAISAVLFGSGARPMLAAFDASS
ncbi:hypothetical protein [Streptomyces decoyicus]|uniref:hypothetical protein n=1 Tax=Streptomyces decoyicus TaxID=249567 RepID=UPI0033A6EE1F